MVPRKTRKKRNNHKIRHKTPQNNPKTIQTTSAQYKKTNTTTTPTIDQNIGQPKKQITQQTINIIKQAYKKDQLNAQHLRKIIYAHQKTTIPQGTIPEVLLNVGYAHHQPSKQKRRAPWVRYERKHSLSLIHTDWHHCKNSKYLCTMLDDSSRKIVAADEFDAETTENALVVLKKGVVFD